MLVNNKVFFFKHLFKFQLDFRLADIITEFSYK